MEEEEIEITDEELNDILLSAKLYDDNYLPGPLLVSGIHKAVFEGNIHTVRLMVESGTSVDGENSSENTFGFTPLHLAVVINNMELVDYLLSRGASVNAQSQNNLTPLHIAAQMCHIQLARKLLETGAEVNSRDSRGNTPLYVSTHHPEMAHLLIQHGADVDSVNKYGATPLHNIDSLETVCMLLYYNADPNVLENLGRTPFTLAQYEGYEDVQRALFDYVPDFGETPDAVKFALGNDPTFVVDIINKGGDVNYGDYEGEKREDCAFYRLAEWRECTGEIFKTVWDKISYNEIKKTIDLNLLFASGELSIGVVKECIQVIIESDNVGPAVESLMDIRNYYWFIGNFAKSKLELEQLTVLTCRLLEYGYRPTSFDVTVVFSFYGFCELLNVLLYVEVDCSKGWPEGAILPRLMFDPSYRLQENEVLGLGRQAGLKLLKYVTCKCLVEKWGKEERSVVPSLTELARDSVRGRIWEGLRVKSVCQFYTVIDNLNVSKGVKKILAFKKALYGVRKKPQQVR